VKLAVLFGVTTAPGGDLALVVGGRGLIVVAEEDAPAIANVGTVTSPLEDEA
jgi:hypothetical protein